MIFSFLAGFQLEQPFLLHAFVEAEFDEIDEGAGEQEHAHAPIPFGREVDRREVDGKRQHHGGGENAGGAEEDVDRGVVILARPQIYRRRARQRRFRTCHQNAGPRIGERLCRTGRNGR